MFHEGLYMETEEKQCQCEKVMVKLVVTEAVKSYFYWMVQKEESLTPKDSIWVFEEWHIWENAAKKSHSRRL